MPERTKTRTIEIEAVNEIRAAHGRLLRALAITASMRANAATSDLYEHVDEAEYQLRRALARIGVEVRGRKMDL